MTRRDAAMRGAMILFCILFAAASPALAAGKRVAVVVGAGGYANVPVLANPPRDARAVAAALQRLGFDTTLVLDPDRAALEGAIRHLGDQAQDAEAALFFFAGHAMEADGRNGLVPVSARVTTARDLPFETVDLDLVMSQLDGRARTVLIFLDACRDNPFLRSLSGAGRGIAARGGLAAPASDVTGTLVAFATAPGRTAADGDGADSPFTTALLHHMETPGLEIRQMLAQVRREVRESTGGTQVPWESSALESDFFLAPAKAANGPVISTEAVAATRCHVPHLSGQMRQGGAAGTVAVVSDGRGCGFSVWHHRASHEPYETLTVTEAPKNGSVRIEDRHRIVYTPRRGFAGSDHFTVASTPAGTVSMSASVTAPSP